MNVANGTERLSPRQPRVVMGGPSMIDMFSLLLSHSLLLLAFWRLRSRDDLDDEAEPGMAHRARGFARQSDEG